MNVIEARDLARDWVTTGDRELQAFADTGVATPAALAQAEATLADYPAEYAADASRIELVALVDYLRRAL